MIKKLLLVLGPAAAVAALSIVPMSASADVFWKCPKGVTDHKYCTKEIKCKVPQVAGRDINTAERLLRDHDCGVGKVTHSGKGRPSGKILRTVPPAGSLKPKGFKVDIIVSTGLHGRRHRHRVS